MWLGTVHLWTYIVGTAVIILLPGPNSMFVLGTAARHGVRDGYRAACGVFLGDGIIMTLSAGGVAALLRSRPWLFDIVKYAGAAYLCYIGYGLLRAAWRRRSSAPAAMTTSTGIATQAGFAHSNRPADADRLERADRLAYPDAARPDGTADADVPDRDMPPDRDVVGQRSPFRRALTVSLLNPKSILFFVAFFIQFVDRTYPYPALSFLVLGTIVEIFSAIYLTVLIFTGSYLAAAFRARRGLARGLTTGLAGVFIGFAIRLATASLS